MGNVVARFRTGAGAAGQLDASVKIQVRDALDGLDEIFLPAGAVGGGPPESGENARIAAPGKLQSLGRLVTLSDFESEALAIPGVIKARAAWTAPDGVPLIEVTVLSAHHGAGAVEAIETTLRQFNHCRGAARHSLRVKTVTREYAYLSLDAAMDPQLRRTDVERDVRRVLGVWMDAGKDDPAVGLFGLRQRDFGKGVHVSQIISDVQKLESIRWVRVATFGPLQSSGPGDPDPTLLTTPATPIRQNQVECRQDQTLRLHERHLQLSIVAAGGIEECVA